MPDQIDKSQLDEIVKDYRQAKRSLLLLDYDGTLAEFYDSPKQAKPATGVMELLANLAGDSSNTVVLISGRDQRTLNSWFSELDVELVAEHGAFVKKNGAWSEVPGISRQWVSSV